MRALQSLSALALASCMAAERRASVDTTQPVAADTSRPGSVATASQEIYIDSVTAGNPLVVAGRARTFENTVQVRVRDATGATITEVFTTSVGEMGHHNPFVATVWLTRGPGELVIVESFEYSAKDGSVRSLVADTVAFSAAPSTYLLDFPASDCTTTVPVRRAAPHTVSVARLLVEMLVAGPDSAERAAGAVGMFPRGSRVESVVLRQGEITVDFNERLQNVGGSCAAQAIRAAVTSTLRRLPSVRTVVITAGGSRDLALQP